MPDALPCSSSGRRPRRTGGWHGYTPVLPDKHCLPDNPGLGRRSSETGRRALERIYVVVGLEDYDAIDVVEGLASELGVELRVIFSPRVRGVIIHGLLARSPEELPLRLAEAVATMVNIDGLALACCA